MSWARPIYEIPCSLIYWSNGQVGNWCQSTDSNLTLPE